MSFTDLLIDTCIRDRYSPGTPDKYGNPKKTWGDYLASPCRLMDSGGREVKIGVEVVIADYLLFLPDIDVTEQDKIIINGMTCEILLVEQLQDNRNNHHKEILLRIVR